MYDFIVNYTGIVCRGTSVAKYQGVFHMISEEVRDGVNAHLTRRQLEVLSLVLEGKSNKEIAYALCCSKRTIDFHLAKTYERLQVSNRVQALNRVLTLGIDLPEIVEKGVDSHPR